MRSPFKCTSVTIRQICHSDLGDLTENLYFPPIKISVSLEKVEIILLHFSFSFCPLDRVKILLLHK